MSEQRIGVVYNIPPEPPKEANTKWFPAGAITIGLEYRDLDQQIAHRRIIAVPQGAVRVETITMRYSMPHQGVRP